MHHLFLMLYYLGTVLQHSLSVVFGSDRGFANSRGNKDSAVDIVPNPSSFYFVEKKNQVPPILDEDELERCLRCQRGKKDFGLVKIRTQQWETLDFLRSLRSSYPYEQMLDLLEGRGFAFDYIEGKTSNPKPCRSQTIRIP